MYCKPGTLSLIVRHLGPVLSLKVFLGKIIKFDYYYYLNINLKKVNPSIRVRNDLELVRASEKDLQIILDQSHGYSRMERKAILSRLLFFKKGFSNCYLCCDKKGNIVSMQWLIVPMRNSLIYDKMKGVWPVLKEHECMVENLYILPEYRKIGVFSTVNILLLKKALDDGFSVCNTFIRKDNIEALNGFIKIGFSLKRLFFAINFLGKAWRIPKT